MAWIDQIDNGISIKTGDGRIYNPEYFITSFDEDFNISEFNFPNIKGTLVDRREPLGRKYSLEILFQGTDHLDIAEEFRISTHNKKYWEVAHPIYGTIFCHPATLKYDSSGLNTTRITGSMIETIITDAPRTTIDPVEKTKIDIENINETYTSKFDGTSMFPKHTKQMTATAKTVYSKGSENVKSGVESNNYFNLFNEANSAIAAATNYPATAIEAMKSLMMYPSLFSESVQFRIKLFVDQITSLQSQISSLTDKPSKMIFENDLTTLMLGLVQSAITPLNQTDYSSMNDVLSIISQITTTYNSIVENLDSIQSLNGAEPDSYISDYENIIGIDSVVNYAVSQLMLIALNSSQERLYICDTDTNVITLTHRFYGISEDQSTIDALIRNNNIGLNELLQIKKGRSIKYYV